MAPDSFESHHIVIVKRIEQLVHENIFLYNLATNFNTTKNQ